MVEATLIYEARKASGGNGKLKLTLVGAGDAETLKSEGVGALRRKRLVRLAGEAVDQGCLISYKDLSSLLFTSISTLKRDVTQIERQGCGVPIRGRMKRRGQES